MVKRARIVQNKSNFQKISDFAYISKRRRLFYSLLKISCSLLYHLRLTLLAPVSQNRHCVWPFCEIGALRVKLYVSRCFANISSFCVIITIKYLQKRKNVTKEICLKWVRVKNLWRLKKEGSETLTKKKHLRKNFDRGYWLIWESRWS